MELRKRADTVLVVTTSVLSEELNYVTNGKVWMQNSKDKSYVNMPQNNPQLRLVFQHIG